MRPQETIIPDPKKENNAKFILIGEDDKDDEELLLEVIGSVDSSFSTIFINNGQEVLQYLLSLEDNLPCLIILDYNMPILNGAEILQALTREKRYESVPKIIWSTSTTEGFRKICMEAGANDYIVKPTNVNELVEMIRYMISLC